jgi:hypothetical protein
LFASSGIPGVDGSANGEVTLDKIVASELLDNIVGTNVFLPAKYEKETAMQQLSCAMPTSYISGLLTNPPSLDFTTLDLKCVGETDGQVYFALKNGIIAAQDGTNDGYLVKPTVDANGNVMINE